MVDRPATVIPNPDPSVITSEAIDRRTENLGAVINARIDGMEKAVNVFQADLTRVPTQLDRAIQGLRDLIEARLVGVSSDLESIHIQLGNRDHVVKTQVDGMYALLSEEIAKLAAVTTERFVGVAAQFSERDTRTDQRAGDTKLAVDAAFAAAKEATSKIEAGFTKAIDGLQQLLNTTTAAINDKVTDLKDQSAANLSDLKERVTAMENRTAGITTANQENRSVAQDGSARLLAIAAIVIAIVIGLGEIFVRVSH
jgi:hypothetical protein